MAGPLDEIKALADTIDQMLDRIDATFMAQERFVANASHELRTPLTLTRSTLEIPMAQKRVPANLKATFEQAIGGITQTEQLLSSLLELAQANLPPKQQWHSISLAKLIRTLIVEISHQYQSLNLRISLNLNDVSILGHPILLPQLVRNLIDNAFRHNQVGGQIVINLVLEQNHDPTAKPKSVLTIENPGPIIETADLATYLQPFYRGKQTRLAGTTFPTDPQQPLGISKAATGGFGLGLSIAKSLTQLHYGQLNITARATGGLKVTLILPVDSAPPEIGPDNS